MKRIFVTLAALLLTTSTVLASGVPVGCSNGTRNEPQPPTITPASESYGPSKGHSFTAGDVCVLANGWRSPGFKADCMTLQSVNSMASELATGYKFTPEVVTPNPDLVIDTKTVKYLVGIHDWQPVYHYVTSDGSCSH